MNLDKEVFWILHKNGGVRATSAKLNIDAGYLSRLASGEKINPSNAVLKKLGLRKVVTYKPIDRNN